MFSPGPANRLCVYCTTDSRPNYPCPQRALCTQERSLWQECPLRRCPPSTQACRVAPNQSRPPASPHTSHTKGRSLVWRRRSSEWTTATATPTMTLTTKTTTETLAATARITSLSKPATHSHLTSHLASHASELHSAPHTPSNQDSSGAKPDIHSKAQDLSIKVTVTWKGGSCEWSVTLALTPAERTYRGKFLSNHE